MGSMTQLIVGGSFVLLFMAIIFLISYLIREENKNDQVNKRINKDIRDMSIKMRQERDRYLWEGRE